MYRYGIVILFIASFFAPFILASDLSYKDLAGIPVDEALHYFEPYGDNDCSDSSDTSDDDTYEWNHYDDNFKNYACFFDSCRYNDDEFDIIIDNDCYRYDVEVDTPDDSHNLTNCLGAQYEQDDLNERDLSWYYNDTDEEPCSPYMHDDEANDFRSARREKRARDMRKDRPYRVEYIESVRDLNSDPLTKERKRQFYNDAQRNYLMDKLSMQKAAKLSLETTSSRRQKKVHSAFLRMVVEYEKENAIKNADDYLDLKRLFFTKDTQKCEKKKRKCLNTCNAWQKNAPEVVIDKRCQNLTKAPPIKQELHKIKIKLKKQKNSRKNLHIKESKQPALINLPNPREDYFSTSQKIPLPFGKHGRLLRRTNMGSVSQMTVFPPMFGSQAPCPIWE